MTAVLDSTFLGNVQAALRNAILAVPGCPPNDRQHWAYENVPFTAPADKSPWIRFTFRPQPNRQVSLGTSQVLIRHFGGALVDYSTQMSSGTQLSDTFASAVLTALRPGTYLTFAGQLVKIVTCFSSQGQPNDPYFMRSITIGWTADTVTVT